MDLSHRGSPSISRCQMVGSSTGSTAPLPISSPCPRRSAMCGSGPITLPVISIATASRLPIEEISVEIELAGEVRPWRPKSGHFYFGSEGREKLFEHEILGQIFLKCPGAVIADIQAGP